MIAGFGGELISHSYLEHLLATAPRDQPASFERRLMRWWRDASATLGPASSARAIHDRVTLPLLDLLAHGRPIAASDACGIAGRLPAADCVLLSTPWDASFAVSWRDAVRKRLAAQASWALVCNGQGLRIVDCTRAWSRAAIAFDFHHLTSSSSGIAALWLLAHAGAFGTGASHSLRAHVAASDAHAVSVCRSLSDGVLEALPRLADALSRESASRADRHASFDQALTIVYRILFLLFAEARALVPAWQEVYRDAYTIGSLIDRAGDDRQRVDGRRFGLWEALQAISRLAHAGCSAGDLQVTAFNGRLFSPRHAPLVEQRRVPDGVVRGVLLSLATRDTRSGRRRISYHDLGVEQLGSVYERVLECEPQPHRGAFALKRTSLRRKATGSFYTPQALTEFVVQRALGPLVSGKTKDEILSLRVLDPAMGSGAFLVAACRYLADACEQATVRDGDWSPPDPAAARVTLRRNVAERCLYGVDLNQTAAQLARLSLWLTTLAADRPLTFLDHHLVTGNSLVGASLSDLSRVPSRQPLKRSDALPLFDDVAAGDVAAVLPARFRMAMEPSDSLDVVRLKERSLSELDRDGGVLGRWRLAADAWCGSALLPESLSSGGLIREWIAEATGGATTLPKAQLRSSLDHAAAVAAGHRAFHWQLAFPEAFIGVDGRPSEKAGFDAVIGNPPWEMMRADTGSSDDRERARDKTRAELRFFRTSRVYQHQGAGHPNSYQLFLERSLQLTRPGGRISLLLPSGIATDVGSAALRRRLFDRTSVDTWIGFDNRKRIFPIHRSVRFVLLAATNEGSTPALRFRSGVTDPSELHAEGAAQRTLTLSRSRLEAWSPEVLTIPELPDQITLRIVTSIADRVPPLSAQHAWNARFGRELNATDDRPHFVALAPALLPVVEGKQLAPFQVDLSRSTVGISRDAARRLVGDTFNRQRIAYRDVAGATNKLTLIAAMLPAHAISTHTVFCLKTPLDDKAQWCLLGLMNSLVGNFLVRLQVTTHVTASLMSRLPVPMPAAGDIATLSALARRLAKTGIDVGATDYAMLNAIAARLYGLTRDEYAFILESFPLLSADLRAGCLAAHSTNNAHGSTETQNHGSSLC